jgi:hypothetical protein
LLPARPELASPRIRLQWATATMEGQAPGK